MLHKLSRSRALLLMASLVCCLVILSMVPQRALAVTVSDDFNRVDGGLGVNWTTVAGTAAPQITGNQVVPGTGGQLNSAYWSADSFTGNQFAQATLPNSTGSQQGPGIAVRLANSRGYFLWYGNTANTVSLWRMDSSSTWTQIATSAALTVSGTDVWRVEAVGATISGYQNGTLAVQASDGTYSTGSPGIWLYNAANQIDNWAGGDIANAYSVGGTVTGLLGTVVLENNSGSDLSITSSGAYSFAAAQGDGTAYAVTVKTNPAGQTCTVANGSGTIASANVTNADVTCSGTPPPVSGADNFNRADGALGSGWSDFSDGGLAISGQRVVGTNGANGNSGDIRTAESYGNNQYSQVEVTSTQLTGGAWIGPAVRVQNGGQDLYVGIYYWNNGNPQLQIFKRMGATWTGIGNSYSCGALTTGTKLRLMVVGSTLAFMEDGVERAAGYDSSLSGGAPGIMDFSSGAVDNWEGGTAGFEVHYLSTDPNGVESYDVISDLNGYGPQILRVLRPDNPAPGVKHNFITALPVEVGLGSGFGDGIETLRALNAQNQYNLTIIEPSFAIEPWYADNPIDPNEQEESFMTTQLAPWTKQNLGTTGYEQQWLIGFSKSGIGGQDLFLKHPDLYTLVASWDFPADESSYNQFGGSSAGSYGTDANFQANYRLTSAFLDARKAPFQSDNRIWIGGYQAFQTDVSDYDTLLTSKGMAHGAETPTVMAHRWDSGWVPLALAALHQDSVNLPDRTAPTVTAFTIPPNYNSLTVPVTAFSAKDDTGVTGYQVTESATPPAANGGGWSGSAPTSYTFSSSGNKTLYAWAKDAAGNVSAVLGATVTVTPPPGGASTPTRSTTPTAPVGGSTPATAVPLSPSPAASTLAPSRSLSPATADSSTPPAKPAASPLLTLTQTALKYGAIVVLLLGGIAGGIFWLIKGTADKPL